MTNVQHRSSYRVFVELLADAVCFSEHQHQLIQVTATVAVSSRDVTRDSLVCISHKLVPQTTQTWQECESICR